MNRRDHAEEKFSARWIWARDFWIVQRASLGRVQPADRSVIGNHYIRVIAKPLHAAIPEITMNVVIWTWWLQQKWNVPQSSQHQPDDDDVAREFRRGEELANRKQVRGSGNCQWNDERRFADGAELACADRQRHEQNRGQAENSAGWRKLHRSSVPVRNSATACPHSFSQIAVRGALAGAIRSSAASRVRSPSTSMSKKGSVR